MQSRYWFPAKRYGWGWGFPQVWQGWAVLVLFIAGIVAGACLLLVERSLVPFLLYTGVLVAILLVICYIKGEPPSWRWGE